MKIIFDIDGTLCFVNPSLREIIKREEVKKAPWPIVLAGLLVFNPKVDPEMLKILRHLCCFTQIKAISERPVKTENYTRYWLQKKGFTFRSVKCLGNGEKKRNYILSEKPDIVVDDDKEILLFCKGRWFSGFFPEDFKKIYRAGVIR